MLRCAQIHFACDVRVTTVDLLQEAVACLQTELPKGSTLIVFGSWARGDARPDSDVDLLVIEPEVTDRLAEMARLSIVLGRRLIPADVIVMTRSAFDQERKVTNSLAWRASIEGVAHDIAA